jgi:hypothetical protein
MSKKTEETKEIVQAPQTTPALTTALGTPTTGFGAADDISVTDIRIDRILLTQAMSKKVQAEEVEKGLLVLQSSLKELARTKSKDKPGTALEFIPIKAMRYWVETDKDTQEFIARYPALEPDEHAWEEKRGARTIKRTYTHAFIVLLPSMIANMEDVPVELAFRSTNLACAQSINMKLLNMKRRQLPSWAKVFSLDITTKTNKHGTWYITNDNIVRDATAEEIASAVDWAKNLETANIKLNDDDEGAEGNSRDNLPDLNATEETTY